MECGKLTAKLRDAVPVCFMVNDHEVKRYKNIEIPIIKILKKGKEYHGFRYTNMIGKARMTMKAALTFMCINLKKLAKILAENPSLSGCFMRLLQFLMSMLGAQNKMASAITC